MSQLMRLDTKIDQLANLLPDLLRNIAEKDDEQITRIAIGAQRLERFAFLIRGVCASVLRQRYPHRLSGGRGRRDHLGQGIQAQMSMLANKVGVDRKTLETDARIMETFFEGLGETKLVHIPPLTREYYVIALAAPDPHAAIECAIERSTDPHYKLEQFRTYVRLLKRDGVTSLVTTRSDSFFTLRVQLPAEAHALLAELIAETGKKKDEIVAQAIRVLHESLSTSAKHKVRNTRSKSQQVQNINDSQLGLEI